MRKGNQYTTRPADAARNCSSLSNDVTPSISVTGISLVSNPDPTCVPDPTSVPDSTSVYHDPSLKSASAKKLKLTSCIVPHSSDQNDDDDNICSDDIERKSYPVYVFFDTSIFIALINSIAKCEKCGSNVETIHNIDCKRGFCHFFTISCTVEKCMWYKTISTSNEIENNSKGRNAYEVNLRSIISFREIGKGLAALETFAGFMNMPPPMNKTAFNDSLKILHQAYQSQSQVSMQSAATEIRKVHLEEEFTENSVVDIAISADGSWQRRGYSSLNGLVTVISVGSGQCIDVDVMTKICKSCEAMEKKKDEEEHSIFLKEHDCPINHKGSAGAMEASGIVKCFQRSIERNNVRYKMFIGDGDSSSYPSVLKADPYPGLLVEKSECIGHIQKRVGSRLRNLKKKWGKTNLDDGKHIGGIGRLRDKDINRLQNYFGIAIRYNTSDIHEMKKSIGTVLFHCCTAKDVETRHRYCSRESNTWCKYWQAINSGTVDYVQKPGLPEAIKKVVKPIFNELSDDTLLKRCLHGKTQNNNEALNGLIWKKVPKDIFVGRDVLEIGVSSAIINFNDGFCGLIGIFGALNLNPGYFTQRFCIEHDEKRIENMELKTTVEIKRRRKRLRAIRKGFQDKAEDIEGQTYASGAFV